MSIAFLFQKLFFVKKKYQKKGLTYETKKCLVRADKKQKTQYIVLFNKKGHKMLKVVENQEPKQSIDIGPLSEVVKRDGEKQTFNADRIVSAIAKAGEATGEYGEDEAHLLAEQVVKVLRHRFAGAVVPTIEQIQDVVEQVLISSNYYKTARSYIVYREQRERQRQDKKVAIDAISSINEYLDRSDWRVNANANQGYSLGGLILNVSGKVVANYWLKHVYTPEIGQAHLNGDYHIHDLDMLSGYCAGWSLRTLLAEGFNGVANKTESLPPKHLVSAFSQMVNFLGTLQNEWAGAQAFSSADTFLAPFIRIENLDYKAVKQAMQSFIFNLNVPSRWGTQTPFINFTFDWTCPKDLRDQHPFVGKKHVDFTYGDLQNEMDIINKAFLEVMTEGDAMGRPFTFPIPTYNITDDFPWEHPNVKPLFELAAKYGIPNFQNFLNSDLNPTDVRSMCCRLRLDVRELLKRGGGLFGSAEKTGSIGVITINLARLGYTHKGDREGLLRELKRLLDLARDALEIKRKIISKNMERGLYPFAKRYLGDRNHHFSTIGVNGANEMVLNFTNGTDNIATMFGKNLVLEVMDFIRTNLADYQETTLAGKEATFKCLIHEIKEEEHLIPVEPPKETTQEIIDKINEAGKKLAQQDPSDRLKFSFNRKDYVKETKKFKKRNSASIWNTVSRLNMLFLPGRKNWLQT